MQPSTRRLVPASNVPGARGTAARCTGVSRITPPTGQYCEGIETAEAARREAASTGWEVRICSFCGPWSSVLVSELRHCLPLGRTGRAVAETVHLCYSVRMEAAFAFHPSSNFSAGPARITAWHFAPRCADSDRANPEQRVSSTGQMFHPPDRNGTEWHSFGEKNGRRPRRTLMAVRLAKPDQSQGAAPQLDRVVGA